MPRKLKATPSTSADVGACQKLLLQDLTTLDQEMLESRTPFFQFVKDYMEARRLNVDLVLHELASVKQQLSGLPEPAALRWAKELLQPKGAKVLGVMPTCILQWRFDEPSMWRGIPDNQRVLRLCKSIVSSRFRADSCIASRTLDMSCTAQDQDVVTFRLLFGDGSARGVAACVVWVLLLRRLQELDAGDVGIVEVVESLMAIPTNFEEHGDGSAHAALVAQAARQNQHAQVLPVSTIEWIGMAKDYAGIDLGSSTASRAVLVRKLEEMVSAYNSHPDVEAYAIEPAAKRAKGRRGSKVSQDNPDEGHDKGLKIGVRRLLAMKNFLQGGTQVGLDILRNHLLWVSDYKTSAISDEILMKKWLYVGSYPQEPTPGEAEVAAVDAKVEQVIPKGASSAPLRYNTPLTARQFELLLAKAVKVFEDNTAHLDRDDLKMRERPKEETSAPKPGI